METVKASKVNREKVEVERQPGAFEKILNQPENVKLLLAAVDHIEADPYSFHVGVEFCVKEKGCGSLMCIGGHMAILEHPHWLTRGESTEKSIHLWMGTLCRSHAAWQRLFYTRLCWPQDSFRDITPETLRPRVMYWLETGE